MLSPKSLLHEMEYCVDRLKSRKVVIYTWSILHFRAGSLDIKIRSWYQILLPLNH